MAEEPTPLSSQELLWFLAELLDGIVAVESGELPEDYWAPEMRLWIELILNRTEGGGA